jgi:hypothetical protein
MTLREIVFGVVLVSCLGCAAPAPDGSGSGSAAMTDLRIDTTPAKTKLKSLGFQGENGIFQNDRIRLGEVCRLMGCRYEDFGWVPSSGPDPEDRPQQYETNGVRAIIWFLEELLKEEITDETWVKASIIFDKEREQARKEYVEARTVRAPAANLSAPSAALGPSPFYEELAQLLGEAKDGEKVKAFVSRHKLKEGSKSRSYCSDDSSYSLMCESGRIRSVLLAVNRYDFDAGLKAFDGPLPYGLQRTDTVEAVVRKLGRPRADVVDGRGLGTLFYLDAAQGRTTQVNFRSGKIESIRIFKSE